MKDCINEDNDNEEAHQGLSSFITDGSDVRSNGGDNLRRARRVAADGTPSGSSGFSGLALGPAYIPCSGCRDGCPDVQNKKFPGPGRMYRVSHPGIGFRIGRAGNIPASFCEFQNRNRSASSAENPAAGERKTGALPHPRDTLFTLIRDGIVHVVSENYDYKTEPYYTILNYETQGIEVRPSSRAVIDAYVVPICLERAARAGIRVREWGISQGYVPLPAIIYGLNYFATTSDLFLVQDAMNAGEIIKHSPTRENIPSAIRSFLKRERSIPARRSSEKPSNFAAGLPIQRTGSTISSGSPLSG
jgi:hypothetical protein